MLPDGRRAVVHLSAPEVPPSEPILDTATARLPAPPSVVFGPMLSLTEVMDRQPLLTYFGFGVP